jgi:hypothetical protein
MRKRKFLIGAVVAVAGSLALASVASGAVVSQTYSSVAQKTKQDKKVRGPVGNFTTNVDTAYDAVFSPGGIQTVLRFDSAFKFDPGNIPDCNPALITGKDAAGAAASCGSSQVGQGAATLRSSPTGASTLPAVVTAFNGVPSGSAPVILLHTDIIGSTTSPILTGTLNGTTLTVDIPPSPFVITHFDTTVNQVLIKKANKKKGKPAKYYVSAKCNDGKWDHSETTTFGDGSSKSGAFTQTCKKKKSKKKK